MTAERGAAPPCVWLPSGKSGHSGQVTREVPSRRRPVCSSEAGLGGAAGVPPRSVIPKSEASS